MSNERITSLEYLKEMTGGEPEFLKEMIDMFLEQIVEFKEGLRDHFDKEEWLELGKLAHKAKSSVMTFGMNPLGYKLKELQLKTEELADIETYEDYLIEFENLTTQASKELKEDLSKL